MIASRKAFPKVDLPNVFTALEVDVDTWGLEVGVNNAYGQLDGSGNIVSLKSGANHGPTGKDFGLIGSGVTWDAATRSLAFNGSGRLRSTGAASVYNYLSYGTGGTYANTKSTSFWVGKIGNVIKPAAANYGMFGNNGGSSASKGMCLNYANTTTNEDTLTSIVTKGVSADFLGRILCPGVCPSNQFVVICVQFDGNASANTRMRLFINDQACLNIPMLEDDNVPVNTPTYPLELGGVGNGGIPLIGNFCRFISASEAMSYDNMIAVIRSLMNKYNFRRIRSSDGLNTSLAPVIFDESAGSPLLQYHLSGIISQDPNNRNRVFSAYSEGDTHVYAANKRLVGRAATNFSQTGANVFGAQSTIYNPADPRAIQDCGGGFDNNGVMHIFVDVLTSGGLGGCVEARHIYSSDLSTWTNTDITASLAADGLAAWRMYGNLVHANGIWVKPYYKATDQGVTTQSANYVLRSTDGINWTSITVRAAAAAYYNEGTVAYLGGNNWLQLLRDEVNGEWQQYLSTDNALTWTSQGAVTFGETVTSPNPPMLKTFTLNGQRVVVAYITNRNNDTAFAIYGLPANLVASGVSGWNLNTKIMWWKTGLAPYHYHYGDVTHLNDTLNALGLYSYDQWPGSGSGSVSVMHYTTMPTWHVSKIESELGI